MKLKLFFYRLKGSSISKSLAIIIGVVGVYSGALSISMSDTAIGAFSILVGTALSVVIALLSYCHFKNQENTNRQLDSIYELLNKIEKNTRKEQNT